MILDQGMVNICRRRKDDHGSRLLVSEEVRLGRLALGLAQDEAPKELVDWLWVLGIPISKLPVTFKFLLYHMEKKNLHVVFGCFHFNFQHNFSFNESRFELRKWCLFFWCLTFTGSSLLHSISPISFRELI